MAETVVVRFGNVAAARVIYAQKVAHDDPVQLTAAAFARQPGSPSIELIEQGTSTEAEQVRRREWLRTLSAEDRPYFLHLLEVEDFWWGAHSMDPPEWVECESDPGLAEAIARYFTGGTPYSPQSLCCQGHTCLVGMPDTWEGPTHNPAVEGPPPLGGGSHDYNPFAGDWTDPRARMLMTNGGQDAFFAQHYGTGAQPAAFNYGALTANSTAESAADTSLTGEIATAGGGLVRKQMTYAHTTGTNTGTLTATWTANASDTLPVTVAKIGVFNASSAGTMGYEKLLSSTATLSTSGDNVTVTYTFTRS